MREKIMVQILQNTQHDLMNNLQVIQGYLSMNKFDVVKTKIADYIDYYSEERKLLNINAPHFILWVMQFNHTHNNVELSYHIRTESVDLSKLDLQLVEDCKQIMSMISSIETEKVLFKINLELNQQSSTNIKLIMHVGGPFKQEYVMESFEPYDCSYVQKSENEITYEFSYTI